MDLLLIKLVCAPLLLLTASLAARRWGAAIGGFLVGLPLTSGPVSLFLALEQGPLFAMHASAGSLAATTGQAAFAAAYYALAGKGWSTALSGASIAFVAAAMTLQWSGPPGIALFLIAILALGTALQWMPAGQHATRLPRSPWWDLPARIVIMAGLVLGVTMGARHMGAGPAGVLASFPFMAAVLGGFAHRMQGAESARLVMRGLCAGLFGFAAFFYVVSLAVTRLPYGVAYGLAIVCALGVQAMALRLIRASV